MRFKNQVVVDDALNVVLKNKNVRSASVKLVQKLGGIVGFSRGTLGVARIHGIEVPVVRVQNNRWITVD